MAEKPDIQVLVGVLGGASIDGESGKQILRDLQSIAKSIKDNNAPKVVFNLDVDKTAQQINKQLQSVLKKIKIEQINLGTNFNKSVNIPTTANGNGISQAVSQKAKYTEATKQEIAVEKALRAEIEKRDALFDKLRGEIVVDSNTTKEIGSIERTVARLGSSAKDLVPFLDKAKKSYADMRSQVAKLNKKDDEKQFITDKEKDNLIETVQTYKEAVNKAKQFADVKKPQYDTAFMNAKTTNDLKDYINTLEKYEQINNRLYKDNKLGSSYKELLAHANNMLVTGGFNDADVKKLRAEFGGLKTDIRAAGLEGQTFGTRLKSQVEKLGVYFSAATVMMGAWRQAKEMIQNVVELDSAVTDLQIATGYTRDETQKLLETYSQMGKELGATTVDVAKAGDTWLRQGYSVADTNTLIKDSMLLSKLGQIDSAEATKALTSSMKGYNVSVEDAIGIVDKFSAVDMNAAVSAGYIATALAETATSARLAGVDLNKVTGYIAAIGETTQDGAESVGNFVKTLFARMGNIKAGNLVDPEGAESLSDVETTLSGLGIKLRASSGEFRNFGEVLDEVASKWSSYGTVNQRAIAVAFSGYRVA